MPANKPAIKVYPSKIDTWLAITILGTVAVILCVSILIATTSTGGEWFLIPFLNLAGSVFPLWILVGTRYRIVDSMLVIKSGPFTWRIALNEIINVVPTRNPLSSPALSMDRLLITCNSGKSVMISPKDKAGFLNDLKSRSVQMA